MLQNFTEWMRRREEKIDESFTTLSQKPGDMVYFGAHDILNMPDNEPLDPAIVGSKLSSISSIGPRGIMVDGPQHHNFRPSSIRKFMGKGGVLTIPGDHLQEISPEMIRGGCGTDADGNPKRLFIFTPNNYTKEMLIKKNRRMMSADAPAAPQGQPMAALPAPTPSYTY